MNAPRRAFRRALSSLGLPTAVCVSLALLSWGCDERNSAVHRRVEEQTEFTGGIVVTDAWQGEWNVVVTFTDCQTGATTMVEDVVDFVCPGDTLRLGGSRLFAFCGGAATDTRIDADCDYTFEAGAGCTATTSVSFHVDRDDGTLTGTGHWATAVSLPTCSDLYDMGCEQITITGVRTTSDTGPCN